MVTNMRMTATQYLALPETKPYLEYRDGEVLAKCRFYRAHGVDVCWLIDPETRTALVFEGERDGEEPPAGVLASPLLPGFSLALADLWNALD